jgi:hypothetical protein
VIFAPKQDAPARRPTSPLDPVISAAPQAQLIPLAAVSSAAPKPRRATHPLQTPGAWPDSSSVAVHDLPAQTKRRAPRWRLLAIAGGVAAIGCCALLFQLRGDKAGDRLDGRAAADSLQFAPAPPAEPVAPVPVAEVAPSSAPVDPQPSAAAERSPAPARAPAASTSAARAEPGSPQQFVEAGRTMLRQGHLGLAEGLFLKALQAQPDSSAAMAEIVRVHLARHDGAEAARWATRLVALATDQAAAQLLLGDAEALHGDSDAAHAAWTRAARAGNTTARERLDDE